MAVALKIEQAEPEKREQLSLKDQMKNILEEARMVLPGIQALFGFQMIAVFNSSFKDLEESAKAIHLVATGFTTIAIGLALAPAAFHRVSEPNAVSNQLVKLCTRFLTLGMVPLALGIVLDLYLVLRVAFKAVDWPLWCGAAALLMFAVLWFICPVAMKLRNHSKGQALEK